MFKRVPSMVSDFQGALGIKANERSSKITLLKFNAEVKVGISLYIMSCTREIGSEVASRDTVKTYWATFVKCGGNKYNVYRCGNAWISKYVAHLKGII